MAAPYNPRVDARHNKRCGPRFNNIVEDDFLLVTSVRPLSLTLGIQGVRVGHQPCNISICFGFLNNVDHAGQRAATRGALGRLHIEADLFAIRAVFLLGGVLEKPDAHIHGNGVKTTAMHDTCAGLASALLVRIDHLSYPLHLPSEIAVIRSRVGAGCHKF